MNKDKGMKYLEKYGYTDEKPMAEMNEKEQESAIKYFQKMNSLPITGEFDKETTEQMNRPRCGRPDHYRSNYVSKFNRRTYIWRKRNLTYKLNNFPRNGLNRQTVLQEISRAFAVWAQHVPLTFRRVQYGRADIEITFNPSHLGDGHGGTLAYAYYPEVGDAFFDTENWTSRSSRGINLFTTAAHEFGHSLGLDHSEVRGALMYPYINPYNPNFRLHSNDISRIQRLYGRGRSRVSLCELEKIDAILSSPDNNLYAFKGDQVWKFENNTLVSEYPKSISEEWPELPNSIDAAYTFQKNICFLKNSSVWIFNGKMKKTVFTNLPNGNIDAGFTIDNRLYLFAGSNYWKYFVTSKQFVLEKGFPKTIDSFWKGIPSSVDAAYYDHMRYIHFFKDDKVYSFDRNNPTEDATSKNICEFLILTVEPTEQ
ncbi:Matrix metalloproteinase 1 [Carabus blaptoides fortunei]